MRRDSVVGLVGAVILLVALVGVFRYESANVDSGPLYGLAAAKTVGGFEGNAAPNQQYLSTVAVKEANLTRLDFVLDASSGTFNLSVKDPSGQVRAMQGSAPVRVSFPVAPVPANGTQPANATAGQGAYTVTVTLVSGASGPQVPVTVPVVGSSGTPFKVTAMATSYEAR